MEFLWLKFINLLLILISAYLLYVNRDLWDQKFHRALFAVVVGLFIISIILDL